MAMNFNSLPDFGRKNETLDNGNFLPPNNPKFSQNPLNDNGIFLSQNSTNFSQNPMNDNGLINSHQLNQQQLQQNHHPNVRHINNQSPTIGPISQLGLGQVVTQIRTTYVTPNRIHVHSVIDYSHLQNHLPLPPTDVLEVTTMTRFLASTTTMERFRAPNYNPTNQTILQNYGSNIRVPNFGSQTLIPNTSVNHRLTETSPFLNPLHQNRELNLRTPRIPYLNDRVEANGGEVIVPKPSSVYASKGKNPVNDNNQNPNLRAYASFLAKGKNPVLDNVINPWQNLFPNPHQLNSKEITNPSSGECSGNDQNDKYDGMIHSFPPEKYGPYICPKCNGKFETPQSFAGHMRSHYKYETSDERERRLAARGKKRKYCQVHTSEGLTLMSEPSIEQVKAKEEIGIKVEEEVQNREIDVQSAHAETSNWGIKKVKEEIVEGNFVGGVEIKREVKEIA